MKERDYQAKLISKIERILPGSIVYKMDANYRQGTPDLLILNGSHWAALECKVSKDSAHQPNQDYYVELMNEMSFASFIYPENESEVLRELQQALRD